VKEVLRILCLLGVKTIVMSLRIYDAHNHLQNERFGSQSEELLAATAKESVVKMVVNGSCEEDWPKVLDLARKHSTVIPSFGYHPWYVKERSPDWQKELIKFLDEVPSAVGEIGLDRWIENYNTLQQEEVFIWQLRLAAERDLPVSIHCLKAWGRLLEILQTEQRPKCGFVLHSFGGPKEMVPALAELGAYFSFPGYFAHERKVKQRESFRVVPAERLLIETDAPDQLLPESLSNYSIMDSKGKPLNHPANLGAVYRFASEFLQRPVEKLTQQVEANFLRVFGKVAQTQERH
jgi:TatD DNase family protein